MKPREPTKTTAKEPNWYASAARPTAPGALTKAEPADLAQTEPEQKTSVGVSRRKVRWIVGIYVVVASIALASGRGFDAVYWAAVAFFFAVSLQPRERVPKLLRYFSIAVVLVLTVVQVVMLILQLKGH